MFLYTHVIKNKCVTSLIFNRWAFCMTTTWCPSAGPSLAVSQVAPFQQYWPSNLKSNHHYCIWQPVVRGPSFIETYFTEADRWIDDGWVDGLWVYRLGDGWMDGWIEVQRSRSNARFRTWGGLWEAHVRLCVFCQKLQTRRTLYERCECASVTMAFQIKLEVCRWHSHRLINACSIWLYLISIMSYFK